MAEAPFYGDPAANAPVWSKYAVLLGDVDATVPTTNAAFTLNDPGRNVSVSTTNASTTVTAATASFTADDVGEAISGTGIPASATVASFVSTTEITISAAATATGTVTAVIGTVVTGAWDPVGALDADNPFDNGEETVDATDHSAAGFGVYATTYKNAKEVMTFIAKETTLVTLGILYDATGVTDVSGTLSGTLKRRDMTRQFKVAFQRESATLMERRISKEYATIDSITRSADNDESLYTVSVLIVPSATDELYSYYLGPKA